jgi:lipoprotein-anchoring transpeptidase ErfK/SrfK
MMRPGLVFAAALSGLAGAALFSTPAHSQANGEPNLGGGFIEFLFGGGQNGRAQPRYREQPAYPGAPVQSDYQRSPGYYQPGMYQDQSGMAQTRAFDPRYAKQVVQYSGKEKPGTIIVDTPQRFLYLVQDSGIAIRYGIGVGRPGFAWAGVKSVTRKAEWPDWVPPKEMLARRPDLPHFMAGGPDNPLGARALYLGSSLYRIHGSNEPWTIGQAVSSGCIRMRNEDVVDLYNRVKVGTRVVVI